MNIFLNFVAVFVQLLPKYSDLVNSDDHIGTISSISICDINNLIETTFVGPAKINLNVITLDLC